MKGIDTIRREMVQMVVIVTSDCIRRFLWLTVHSHGFIFMKLH